MPKIYFAISLALLFAISTSLTAFATSTEVYPDSEFSEDINYVQGKHIVDGNEYNYQPTRHSQHSKLIHDDANDDVFFAKVEYLVARFNPKP